MRKNRLFILGIFTVMVALVSLSLVSGTWAKYTSTVSGEDSAKVAKWEVVYRETDQADVEGGAATTETIEFDLFKTVIDTKNDATETDIAANDGSLIAPGTKGEFKFTVTNNSEVNATYSITYVVTLNGVPVQFSVNSGAASSSIANVEDAELGMGDSVTYTITWEWPYDGTDSTDTQHGINETSVSVSATIEFVQVD